MSAQAAVFSTFKPRIRRGVPRQSIEVTFLDASSWIAESLQALVRLELLTEGWDSYGGLPPKGAALNAARTFLGAVPVHKLPPPCISAVADGGVGFHWRIADRDLEIEFSPEGTGRFLKSAGRREDSLEGGELALQEQYWALWNWLLGS